MFYCNIRMIDQWFNDVLSQKPEEKQIPQVPQSIISGLPQDKLREIILNHKRMAPPFNYMRSSHSTPEELEEAEIKKILEDIEKIYSVEGTYPNQDGGSTTTNGNGTGTGNSGNSSSSTGSGTSAGTGNPTSIYLQPEWKENVISAIKSELMMAESFGRQQQQQQQQQSTGQVSQQQHIQQQQVQNQPPIFTTTVAPNTISCSVSTSALPSISSRNNWSHSSHFPSRSCSNQHHHQHQQQQHQNHQQHQQSPHNNHRSNTYHHHPQQYPNIYGQNSQNQQQQQQQQHQQHGIPSKQQQQIQHGISSKQQQQQQQHDFPSKQQHEISLKQQQQHEISLKQQQQHGIPSRTASFPPYNNDRNGNFPNWMAHYPRLQQNHQQNRAQQQQQQQQVQQQQVEPNHYRGYYRGNGPMSFYHHQRRNPAIAIPSTTAPQPPLLNQPNSPFNRIPQRIPQLQQQQQQQQQQLPPQQRNLETPSPPCQDTVDHGMDLDDDDSKGSLLKRLLQE